MDNENRAIRFANRVKNLNRFMVVCPVTAELYGYRVFVLDEKKLKSYYERCETNSAWRDFIAFRNEIQHRIESSGRYPH